MFATKTFPANQVISLSVHTESGRILVSGQKGGDVKVQALRPAGSKGKCDLIVELKKGVLSLEARKPEASAQSCDAGFSVTLPRGVPLEAYTGSGAVEASVLRNGAKIRTGSGSVRVADVRGRLHVLTGSGDIEAVLSSPALDARSGSGRVRLTLMDDSGSASIRTGSGDIDVAAPKGVAAKLKLVSASGGVAKTLADDPRAALSIEALSGSGKITVHD